MADKKLDVRLNVYRENLAARSLKGLVDAPKYAAGELCEVVASAAPVRRAPRFDAPLDTEALHGERVTVYDEAEGWAWGQLERDRYVGYLPSDCLTTELKSPTHKIVALSTFVYPAADIKAPPLSALSYGAAVAVTGMSGDFAELGASRFLFAQHVARIGFVEDDYVAVAERFVGTPYLWGGRQSLGLDCSALVQLAVSAAGISCPRDSDMQEAELGEALQDWEDLSSLRRGDLIFWSGHVAIVAGGGQLLHASAYHMMTVIEDLVGAVRRLGETGNDITSVRRL